MSENAKPQSPAPVHSVFDTESRIRQFYGEVAEAERQQHIDALARIEDHARFVKNNNMDDFVHQAGQMLELQDFIARLRKVVGGQVLFERKQCTPEECEFLGLPAGAVVMHLMRPLPDGTKESVANFLAVERVPEYTLILLVPKVIERLPTDNVLIDGKRYKGFHGHDFPDFEEHRRPDGAIEYKPLGPMPNEVLTWEPAGQIPGWRSVLLLCLAHGLATLGAVEREFGSSDRATWAGKTEKQRVITEV